MEPAAGPMQPSEPALGGSSPLVLALIGIGIMALIAGLVAAVAGSDREGLVATDTTEDAAADSSRAQGSPAQESPAQESLAQESAAEDAGARDSLLDDLGLAEAMGALAGPLPGESDFPDPSPGAGSESEQRDALQSDFDRTNQVTVGSGDDKMTITRMSDGTVVCNGTSGRGIRIAPGGTGAAAAGDRTALVPDANGEFSGLRVNGAGDVVPVRKGEETNDTVQFRFGDDGKVKSIELPGSDEILRLTPDGPLGHADRRPQFGAGVEGLSPDVLRDVVQHRLDTAGSAELGLAGRPVLILQHPSGVVEMIGPNSESVFLSPELVGPSQEPGAEPGNSFALSLDGPYAGFRVDETGQIVPVRKGEETNDMFALGFGTSGVVDLVLPDAEGEALRVSPGGERADASWYGEWSNGRKEWMPNPAISDPDGESIAAAAATAPQTDRAEAQADASTDGQDDTALDPASGDAADDAAAGDAIADSPAADEPAANETAADEPALDELAVDEPAVDEPGADERDSGVAWARWLTGVGVVALVAAAGLWFMRRRSGDVETVEVPVSPQPSPMLGVVSSLGDSLHHVVDPREAILKAYSDLESGLADSTHVRGVNESPKAFLRRTIGANPAAERPVSRLTELFELARFSDYPITEAMRDEAIAAVEETRRSWRTDTELVAQ